MNAPAFSSTRYAATRHRLTVEDVWRMMEAGIVDPDGRYELIDGELSEMPSDGEAHINYKAELNRWFVRRLPDGFRLVPDSSLHLSPTDTPSPDIYIHEEGVPMRPIDPAAVRLVIEVSDSSLSRDLETKASLYARYGLPEYWVVDVQARVVHVHRTPTYGTYAKPIVVHFDDVLTPLLLPIDGLRIARLTGG